MNFTKEIPNKTGFYAWRYANGSFIHCVECFLNNDNELLVNVAGHTSLVENKGGEWCRLVLENDLKILSEVGTCNCLTKTPEIKYHKDMCVYRLIVERNSLLQENNLLLAVARAVNEWNQSDVIDATSNAAYVHKIIKALKILRETGKVEL